MDLMSIKMDLLYLLAAIVPLIGFIYGRIVFRKKTALYLRLIIDGVGSIALSRLFIFVKLLTENEIPQGFHIGMLSVLGTFACFFTANFGQIDTLCDDGTAKYRKYRITAVIAPVFAILNYLLLFSKMESIGEMTAYGIASIMIGFADYYHLKLLIIPDVDFGIAKCLRPFNLLALLYSALCLVEIYLSFTDESLVLTTVLIVIMTVASGLLVPTTVKGVGKWTV